jgi:uncharacterized membrane protein YtjA (UPF0391 family)
MRRCPVLAWALTFCAVSVIAGILGFAGVGPEVAASSRFLFVVSLLASAVAFIMVWAGAVAATGI